MPLFWRGIFLALWADRTGQAAGPVRAIGVTQALAPSSVTIAIVGRVRPDAVRPKR